MWCVNVASADVLCAGTMAYRLITLKIIALMDSLVKPMYISGADFVEAMQRNFKVNYNIRCLSITQALIIATVYYLLTTNGNLQQFIHRGGH